MPSVGAVKIKDSKKDKLGFGKPKKSLGKGTVFFPPRMPSGPSRPGFLPIRLCLIMVMMEAAFTPPDPYDCLDLFSGERAISKAFAAKKLRSCELDIAHDPRDDILSPGGFCRFLWAAMNLKENGLMVAGIKCSTWSIVNRYTSGRTMEKPLGNRRLKSVKEGNLMVARMCLIVMVCLHRGAHFLLENPLQSLIFQHPRLRKLLDIRGYHETNTYLGAFGAPTWKPVKLISDDKCVEELKRKLDRTKFKKSDSTKCYLDKRGRKRFQGSRKLRSTQVYPVNFGRSVCKLFLKNSTKPSWPKHIDYTNDSWSDAKLGEVENFLVDYLNKRQST